MNRHQYTISDILKVIGDLSVKVVGDQARTFDRPAGLSATDAAGAISFYSPKKTDLVETINQSKAAVIICDSSTPIEKVDSSLRTLIVCEQPRLNFIKIVRALFDRSPPTGIHPTAVIHPEARLGNNIYIGPNVYIGQCQIGDDSVIYANACLYDRVVLGKGVIISSGVVIGTDGFGLERDESGEPLKFPHLGGVLIGDNVEIGANTCVDRGTIEDTVIESDAKIDNLIHIAHNVHIGKGVCIAALSMIAGSVTIGEYSWVAPSTIIRNQVTLGKRCFIGLGALVVKDVADGETVAGSPARPLDQQKKILAGMKWAAEQV